MGICSGRHFLLTICTIQLLTTIERQVFDFLGYMWAPILVNFFNIIFVILGFFGAFQYRPKYIISYCIWNVVWLGWNIFCICFYLDVGTLDKNSSVILNLGTGSFSWWQVNGPGCKADYEITELDLYRPKSVTNCLIKYEIIEVLHASIQCLLACIAIVGGICLSRAFLEEDDSFDFVGGGDFGLAGHTPLHPMYVSYSALPPAMFSQSNPNYQSYSRGTIGSNNSSIYRETTLPKMVDKFHHQHQLQLQEQQPHHQQQQQRVVKSSFNDTIKSSKSSNSNTNRMIDNIDLYNDYSNPLDHLHRPISPPGEYDSLNSSTRLRFDKNQLSTRSYSPVVSPVMRRARNSQTKQNQNRNSYRPRVFIDHVREQPFKPTLKSYHSDPRLDGEHQINLETNNDSRKSIRNSRPVSLYASKL